MKNVGILLFNEVEFLDFAGPYEVFCTASRLEERAERPISFKVFTIAAQKIIIARGGLKIEADYLLQDSPKIDIFLVPGGVVAEPCNSLEILEFIKKVHATTEITASICTGAFLLAKNGLLDGLTVTTHWEDIAELSQNPFLKVVGNQPYVDQGKIVTSAGIASGISMCLHLISRLDSKDLAERTARQIEYPYKEVASL